VKEVTCFLVQLRIKTEAMMTISFIKGHDKFQRKQWDLRAERRFEKSVPSRTFLWHGDGCFYNKEAASLPGPHF
jgi:hypothetical protein